MKIKGELRYFDKSLIMGILNLTPDSFFKTSRHSDQTSLLTKAEEMIKEGVDILDLGAYSSRPGAEDISENEEWSRLGNGLIKLRKEFPETIISVDTFRSSIAVKSVENGADIINDISGGELDDKMLKEISKLNVPYVLMHMTGSPQTMQKNPLTTDTFEKVYHYFSSKIKACNSLGINDVIIDPGFGFGKTLEGNFLLLKSLSELRSFDCPILVGLSRKSMLNKIIEGSPEDSLDATTSANTIALLNGANILRVHDVKAAKDAVQVVSYYQKA